MLFVHRRALTPFTVFAASMLLCSVRERVLLMELWLLFGCSVAMGVNGGAAA